MNTIQKLFLFFLPLQRWKEAAIQESMEWICRCKTCGFERSVWDAGGVRFKAYGNKREYQACPTCPKGRWFVLYHLRQSPLKND